MKQSTFITLFLVLNITLVLVHLYKQNQIIKLSYIKQKIELEKASLIKQKEALTHQLSIVHDRNQVKQFAQNTLGLKPVKISQIKKIDTNANL